MTPGIVRWYDADEGWGVLDSEATPGGCAVIFMSIEMEGFKLLTEGQHVSFTFQPGPQDGYDWVAGRVIPTE